MAIISSIFNVINDKIKEHGISKVIQVKLVAGDMTGVEDLTMKACFELFAEATPAEGARLVIEHVPVKARCDACGKEFAVKYPLSGCNECGSDRYRIVSGKELYIDSMEAV